MLVIENIGGLDKKELNFKKSKVKKNQILLYDTYRRISDFINMLKYRKMGEYDDIPHFIISKQGVVYQILDSEKEVSNTFGDKNIDRRLIKIALENIGWLNKNTINGMLSNWIGDVYRTEPFIKNWRGHFFWDNYTDVQYESVNLLCEFLCDKHNIEKKIVPSHGYFENASNFNGIVCKSNYSDIYTDINPSFNFKNIFKDDKKDIK